MCKQIKLFYFHADKSYLSKASIVLSCKTTNRPM